MKRRLALALLLAACTRHAPPPPAAKAPKLNDDSAERSSVLELAHGTTVIARTGEMLLQTSALNAVDGDPGTFWMNPPGELPQSITFALPARFRIDRIGLRTVAGGAFTANHLTFAASSDGRTFTPVTTVQSADTSDAQWFDVKPFEASEIRVSIDDALRAGHDVRVHSLLARGTPLGAARGGDIAGCWDINGQPAQFKREGTHVTGILETGREPIRFDGGFDGLLYRLQWVRGNDYGYSLITVSNDGQHLSGLNWHEEAIPMFFDTAWFAERGACKASIDHFDVPLAYLRRTGRFSLFDDSQLRRLIKAFPDAELVAHEFRFATAEANRKAAQESLDRLHAAGIKLVAQGSADPRQQPVTEPMRVLYSTVDFQIRR